MEFILIVVGIVIFLDSLFEKLDIWKKLQEWSMKKTKFIYDLFNCKFCCLFHLGTLVTIFMWVLIQPSTYLVFLTPSVCSGLINLIKNR